MHTGTVFTPERVPAEVGLSGVWTEAENSNVLSAAADLLEIL